MKKYYKLIKTYPGSPEIGATTSEYFNDILKNGCCKVTTANGVVTFSQDFRWSNVINYPKYWQEVIEYPIGTKVINTQTKVTYVKQEDGWYRTSSRTAYTDEVISQYDHMKVVEDDEKEYEILVIKSPYTTTLLSKKTNPTNFPHDYLKYLNKNQDFENYEIYSIKRISDGEEITIGDTLLDKSNPEKGSFKLKAFEFEIAPVDKGTGKLTFIHDHSVLGKWINLQNLKKVKEPLFKTEDGVDIFKGDNYCKINNHSDYSLVTGFVAEGTQDNYRGLKFSTKEKAEEYMIMNKPCLSINDITYGLNHAYVSNTLMEELIKKVKQKNDTKS